MQEAQSDLILAAIEMMIGGKPGSTVGDSAREALTERAGYRKIVQAAEQARSLGHDYIWVVSENPGAICN